MDDVKNHRTARDQLTYEMLGDIGRLHDSVESLKGVLPGQIDKVEEKIVVLIGLLAKAGDAYRTQIETYTNEQADKVRAIMEHDAQAAKTKFAGDTQAALANIERSVKNTVQTEIAAPVKSVLRAQQQSIWRTLALCLICGIVSGGVVLFANIFHYDKREAAFSDLGKAVALSWDKLDNKAKATINAER